MAVRMSVRLDTACCKCKINFDTTADLEEIGLTEENEQDVRL